MPFDADRYIALYEQWLNETDGDARIIVAHQLATMENDHPVLRTLN